MSVVLIGGSIAYFVIDDDEASAREIASLSTRVLTDFDTVSLSLRSSLRYPDGSVKYTDSDAVLDLKRDRAFVDLPEVLRNDSLELVSEGLSLYLTIPPDLRDNFAPVRWLRLDTAGRAEARGARLGPVPDPTSVLLALAGSTGDVERLGRKELDDKPFDVVRVEVRPELMAERVGADNVGSANMLGGLSLEWEADVWRDKAGRLHRVVLRTQLAEGKGQEGHLSLDLRVGNFDEPIDIGIPPADAVQKVESAREALVLLEAG